MIMSSRYQIYKILHYLGIMFLFFGLGGVLIAHFSEIQLKARAKIMAFASHGLGLLLLIVAGFGMMAQLGLTGGIPYWIYIKLAIWIFFALAISFAKRKAGWMTWAFFFIIGALAPYVVLFRT